MLSCLGSTGTPIAIPQGLPAHHVLRKKLNFKPASLKAQQTTKMEQTQVWTKAFTAMHSKFEKWCVGQGIEMVPSIHSFQPTRKRNSNKIQEFIMANQFTKNKRPISSVEVWAMFDNDNPSEKQTPKVPQDSATTPPESPKHVPQEDMTEKPKPKKRTPKQVPQTTTVTPPESPESTSKSPKVNWNLETKARDFDWVNDLDFDTDTLINHFGEPQKTGEEDDFWTYEWKLTFEGGEFSIFDWVSDNASPHMTECWFISWDSQHNKQYDSLMTWLEAN